MSAKQLRKDIETLKRAIQPKERDSSIHLLMKSYDFLTKGKLKEAEKLWNLYKKKYPDWDSDPIPEKYKAAIKKSARRNLRLEDDIT